MFESLRFVVLSLNTAQGSGEGGNRLIEGFGQMLTNVA